MANYEATRYDFDGANLSGIEGIPTATIVPWSTASVPSGFLECAGAAVSRSTYAALFAIIGTTYGAGDGSTTFNVPDLQDNVAIGKSGTKNLGSTGGANTVTPTGNISGNVAGSTANATLATGQLASHNHQLLGQGGNTAINGPGLEQTTVVNFNNQATQYATTTAAGSGQGHSHNMSANFSGSFSGSANSVVQPYLTVMYIIKT
jgi:microcystin-dependent protein